MTDTANNHKKSGESSWYLFKETDTIGRYYYSELNDTYIACLIDYGKNDGFETHVLTEFKKENQGWKCIAKERYIHGNYPSCWSNWWNGFEKFGNIFAISYCGTGSCFSSTHKQFFTKVVPQDWENCSIQTAQYSCSDYDYEMSIESQMTIKDSLLIFTYHFKERNELEKTSTKSEFFTNVVYTFRNNKIKLKDSTNFKKIPLGF